MQCSKKYLEIRTSELILGEEAVSAFTATVSTGVSSSFSPFTGELHTGNPGLSDDSLMSELIVESRSSLAGLIGEELVLGDSLELDPGLLLDSGEEV